MKKVVQKHHLSPLFTRVYNLNKNKDLELDFRVAISYIYSSD